MDKYEEIEEIGSGNFGTAHLIRERASDNLLVVKKIRLTRDERKDAEREAEVLASLEHPNILEFVDNFVENYTMHIVTLYCDGGDLAAQIKRQKEKDRLFTEDYIVQVFVQIAMAVDYIHQKSIIHRDLKTQNIFLTKNGAVKLGDFGIAKNLDSTLNLGQTVVGTPYYLSPELCDQTAKSDYKSDMWALGCVLYELCTLNHAFTASNILTLAKNIVEQAPPPIPAHYSNGIRKIVKLLLTKNPNERPLTNVIFGLSPINERLEQLAENPAQYELTKTDFGASIGNVGSGYRHMKDPSQKTMQLRAQDGFQDGRNAATEPTSRSMEACPRTGNRDWGLGDKMLPSSSSLSSIHLADEKGKERSKISLEKSHLKPQKGFPTHRRRVTDQGRIQAEYENSVCEQHYNVHELQTSGGSRLNASEQNVGKQAREYRIDTGTEYPKHLDPTSPMLSQWRSPTPNTFDWEKCQSPNHQSHQMPSQEHFRSPEFGNFAHFPVAGSSPRPKHFRSFSMADSQETRRDLQERKAMEYACVEKRKELQINHRRNSKVFHPSASNLPGMTPITQRVMEEDQHIEAQAKLLHRRESSAEDRSKRMEGRPARAMARQGEPRSRSNSGVSTPRRSGRSESVEHCQPFSRGGESAEESAQYHSPRGMNRAPAKDLRHAVLDSGAGQPPLTRTYSDQACYPPPNRNRRSSVHGAGHVRIGENDVGYMGSSSPRHRRTKFSMYKQHSDPNLFGAQSSNFVAQPPPRVNSRNGHLHADERPISSSGHYNFEKQLQQPKTEPKSAKTASANMYGNGYGQGLDSPWLRQDKHDNQVEERTSSSKLYESGARTRIEQLPNLQPSTRTAANGDSQKMSRSLRRGHSRHKSTPDESFMYSSHLLGSGSSISHTSKSPETQDHRLETDQNTFRRTPNSYKSVQGQSSGTISGDASQESFNQYKDQKPLEQKRNSFGEYLFPEPREALMEVENINDQRLNSKFEKSQLQNKNGAHGGPRWGVYSERYRQNLIRDLGQNQFNLLYEHLRRGLAENITLDQIKEELGKMVGEGTLQHYDNAKLLIWIEETYLNTSQV